jgi:hypothetical protein
VLDGDRAEPQDRVERDDVLRTVGQNDRDGVAFADAERLNAAAACSIGIHQVAIRRSRPKNCSAGASG